MPYVLLILGEMLFISGIKGTQQDLFNLLKNDFSGAGSFIYWLGAIALIGAIGYIPKAKPFSNALLILILVVLIIHQNPKTLFSQFTSGLQTASAPSNSTSTSPITASNNNVTSPSQVTSPAGTVATLASEFSQAADVAASFA